MKTRLNFMKGGKKIKHSYGQDIPLLEFPCHSPQLIQSPKISHCHCDFFIASILEVQRVIKIDLELSP